MINIDQFNIGNYNTDKFAHGYWSPYLTHFSDKRLSVKTVCEIGVFTGESVKLWRDFFPNATIHGLDITPECKRFNADRIEISIGDQRDTNFLDTVIKKANGKFDIIIDDGVHDPEYQRASLKKLFPYVNKYGAYVIEDVGPVSGRDFVGMLKKDVDEIVLDIMSWPENLAAKDWTTLDLTSRYTGIALYPFIIFIIK